MLESVPFPTQAILWPLLGAALILVARRFLPNWLRRVVALVVALASLTALRSLIGEAAPLALGTVERMEILWEPLNLFRLSPTLEPDGLSLLVGITLAGTTAATVLGIRGSEPQRTAWHGLALVALAGCLVMSMASDLLSLAMGSALLDLSLMAAAVSAPGASGRVAWRMVVPGAFSTMLIVVSALQLDTQLGTASLQAENIAVLPLVLLGTAGILRLLIYPLHPRGLHTPENGILLLLSANAGLYLVLRTQSVTPVLSDQSWMMVAGGAALLAGGVLAWTAGLQSRGQRSNRPDQGTIETEDSPVPGLARSWPGIAVHQAGYALAFVLLVSASMPWPMLSMTVALSMLAIWWDGTLEGTSGSGIPRREGLVEGLEAWRTRAGTYIAAQVPSVERWRGSWPARHGAALFPAIALASLAGLPLTIGALGRWPFYATLLKSGQASMLIAVVVADASLAAGLWLALGTILKQDGEQRPNLAALLALAGLAVAVLIIGIAPGAVGLERMESQGVSFWALGVVYVLPWLVGGWLTRVRARSGDYVAAVRRIVGLGWVYRAANWAGQRLVTVVHWLGQVGEGEAWWGWALVILALGAMLLIIR
jgi:hypothetical protein